MNRILVCLPVVAMLVACADSANPPTCSVSVQLSPSDPTAPASITATASVDEAGVFGFTWSVSLDGDPIATMAATPDGRRIDFVANDPGVYEIDLAVGGCDSWRGSLNVRDPGADLRTLRLRLVPPPGGPPAQERIVMVPGGADWNADVVTIDPGTSRAIAVRDGSGALVPAYVRLAARATPDAIVELVTGTTGDDRAMLATGAYDVLIVPMDNDLAPARIDDWDPLIDGPGALVVGAGTAVTGVVRDPAGVAIAGARVSLVVADGEAPSTIATSAADGSFTLRWRPSGGASIAVVPPRATGLPRLSAPIEGLAGQPWQVRYAPSLAPIELGGVPVRIAGAPATGGHVTFALDAPAAGTVGDGATLYTANGRHADTIAIGGDGTLAPYRATAGSGRIYIGAAPGDASPGAVMLLDLSGGVPAALDGPAPIVMTGGVAGAGGVPVPGASLRATLSGELAHLGAAAPRAIASANGAVSLVVAANATYDVDVVDPRRTHAALRRWVSSSGVLGTITMERAIEVRGEVRVSGQSTGLPSVAVSALCYVCTGLDRSRSLGDAVSDGAGAWRVAIPDPGTGSP